MNDKVKERGKRYMAIRAIPQDHEEQISIGEILDECNDGLYKVRRDSWLRVGSHRLDEWIANKWVEEMHVMTEDQEKTMKSIGAMLNGVPPQLAFANEKPGETWKHAMLRSKMQLAAAEEDYEKALGFKKRLEALSS